MLTVASSACPRVRLAAGASAIAFGSMILARFAPQKRRRMHHDLEEEEDASGRVRATVEVARLGAGGGCGRGNRAVVITPPVRRCRGSGETASYEAEAATVRDQCLSPVPYHEISAPTVSSTYVQVMPAACIRGGQLSYHLAPNMYGAWTGGCAESIERALCPCMPMHAVVEQEGAVPIAWYLIKTVCAILE